MKCATRLSSGRWAAMETTARFAALDDKMISQHDSQVEALEACGRSWFTIRSRGKGNWMVEGRWVGERSVTAVRSCSGHAEAMRFAQKLLKNGFVQVEDRFKR